MINFFQNLKFFDEFRLQFLHISGVLYFKMFNHYFSISVLLDSEIHHTKASFSNLFFNDIVTFNRPVFNGHKMFQIELIQVVHRHRSRLHDQRHVILTIATSIFLFFFVLIAFGFLQLFGMILLKVIVVINAI